MSNKKDRDRLVFRFRQGQREKFFGAARSLCDLSLCLVGESIDYCQPTRTGEELLQTVQLILRQAEALQRLACELQRNEALAVSSLQDEANVLIMPTLDAANIAMHLMTVIGEGVAVGPILTGLRYPAHILPPASSVRRVVNMSALAVVDAQAHHAR